MALAHLFAWHGVTVDRAVVLQPETITLEAIDTESNVERRRVLVERFGAERLIRGAELVHEDETGRLWRRGFRNGRWGSPTDEPLTMLEVVNSTPEPDGSRKTYFLRVPPNMWAARGAVPWTFGLGLGEYAPARES